MFQNELIPSIELDARLAVDTLCAELNAEPALWLRAIAARFPGPANLALHCMLAR
jgi:hypothetical protein